MKIMKMAKTVAVIMTSLALVVPNGFCAEKTALDPAQTVQPVVAADATDSTAAPSQTTPATSNDFLSQTLTLSTDAEPDSVASAAATEIRVTSNAALLTALNNATGGETIVLAAGNYGSITFSNKQYTSYVTIRSESTTSRAVFDTINLTNVSNMSFQNIVINHVRTATDTDYTRAFYVKNSSNIEVLNCEFYGSVDGNYNNDVRGFGTSFTNNVRFENNLLHDLFYGVTLYDSDYLTVKGNTFRDIRCDGAAFQSASHVLIENNTFTSFHPLLTGTTPDHPDFIQFWNETGTKDMTDITIRGNTMLRGTGDWTQSIFIQTKSTNGLYVGKNILIEYNIIYNGNMQGITVYDAVGLTVQYNTVLADWTGLYTDYRTIPRLQILNTTNAVIKYNVLTYYYNTGDTGTLYQDNVMVQFTDGTYNNYAQLF